MSAEELIRAALPDVQALVARAFADAGGVAPPGSALDQLGLVDGHEIVLDSLEHGEWGIAFEHLVYMAEATELPLSESTFRRIAEAGRALALDPRAWESLPRRASEWT